jgi:hypothetical protein
MQGKTFFDTKKRNFFEIFWGVKKVILLKFYGLGAFLMHLE